MAKHPTIEDIERAVEESGGDLEFFLEPAHLKLLLDALRTLHAFQAVIEHRLANPADPIEGEPDPVDPIG